MVKITAMSDFLENAVLDLVLRGVSYTGGSNIYAALFTTPTTDAGGGTEVVGGAYVRAQVTAFDPATSGLSANSASVAFATASAPWGLVTHFALFDDPATGNLLYHGPLSVPRTVNAGDTFVFPPGNITISHD